MSFAVGNKFLVGINLGWLSYGSDLGYSEFSDFPLSVQPLDAPITIDLSKPNISQTVPTLTQNSTAADEYFASITGLDIVRLWLFEQLEGLVFTKDGKNNLSSLEPTFLSNLLNFLDSAHNHNIMVYLVLFNSWDTTPCPPPNLNPSRTAKYQEVFFTRKQIIIKIIQEPDDFCNKILIPLLEAIKDKPAIFAIDLINEPESMTESNLISLQQLQNFVKVVTNVVNQYKIKASVGDMRQNIAMNLSSISVDFSDIHGYNDPGVANSTAKLEPYNAKNFSDKPCIVGECGYHPNSRPYNSDQEVPVLQNFLQLAHSLGYSGALAWRYQDYKNPAAVLEAVLDFAKTGLQQNKK